VVHNRCHHESSHLCAVISSVGAERNVFRFIIETVDNGVSNVDLSVGLYRVLEKLPNIRQLSMEPKMPVSECVCMNSASSLGTIQNMDRKRRFKFSAQPLANLNSVNWCYI
jgi:hypothetical protein